MNSIKATARRAGLVYVLFALLGIVGYLYVPSQFVVANDAAATAAKIAANPMLYRIGILAALAGQLLFILLAVLLYELFRDVDRRKARILVALVLVGVAGEVVNLAFRAGPLVFTKENSYFADFSEPQLAALGFGFTRVGHSLSELLTSFWGLWLFPFGYLTVKSGYFPKVIGYLQYVAGIGYVVSCVTGILALDMGPVTSTILTAFSAGEFPMILWLLIVGAREPQSVS
jgi:uncharacterized protein DUF4386